MSWQFDAACADVPDTMQPDRPRPSQMLEAARLCASCPVFNDCAKLADEHEAYGVWAGKWHGPYEPVSVWDVCTPSELRDMLGNGMTVRAIAAQLDVTKRQVEDAMGELAQMVRDRSA